MEYAMVDATIVKVHTGTARRQRGSQAIARSKVGMTTKTLALSDALGNLVRFELLPGNRYDTIGVAPLLERVEFGALLGDNALDSNWIVQGLDQRGAKVVISQQPRTSTEAQDRRRDVQMAPSHRNFFCKLNESKRIAMRACKTDHSFSAVTYLAAAVINARWLPITPSRQASTQGSYAPNVFHQGH